MMVRTGTPTHIIARLNAEIVRILRTPEVAELLSVQRNRIVASTPEEFAAHIKQETARWAKVIKTAGVKPG